MTVFDRLVSEISIPGNDQGIEFATSRCNQRVGPVQVGSGRRDLARDASRRPDRPLISTPVVAEPLDIDVDRQHVEVVVPAGDERCVPTVGERHGAGIRQ